MAYRTEKMSGCVSYVKADAKTPLFLLCTPLGFSIAFLLVTQIVLLSQDQFT